MSLINYNNFFSLISESATSGKISIEKKCPFCGSKITYNQTKAMQTRIGRIRFLLRSIEEGSETAKNLLWKILITREYLGGIDMPLDSPKWWIDAALKISSEIGESKVLQIKKQRGEAIIRKLREET